MRDYIPEPLKWKTAMTKGRHSDYISIWKTNPSLRECVSDTRKARKQEREAWAGEISKGLSRAEIRTFGGQRNSLALAHTPIRASPCFPTWWAMLQLSHLTEAEIWQPGIGVMEHQRRHEAFHFHLTGQTCGTRTLWAERETRKWRGF